MPKPQRYPHRRNPFPKAVMQPFKEILKEVMEQHKKNNKEGKPA